MAVSKTTARILGIKSGNRCAKPGCNNRLTEPATVNDPEVIIGQIAHIVSQADGGPRSDPSMPKDQRDQDANLLMLCGLHHPIADRQENSYTVEELREWKRQHESACDQLWEAAAGKVTFVELEIIADAIAATPREETPGFALTEVREKLARNDLTERISQHILTGMINADLVKDFVAARAQMDPEFPDRLRGGFVEEYERHYAAGRRGDDLFLDLEAFASGPSIIESPHRDLERRVAGLAVLVHLFRICEVFEP